MIILPVIHYKDDKTAWYNADMAFSLGANGIFLISMEGNDEPIVPLAVEIQEKYKTKQIGINLLTLSALDSIKLGKKYSIRNIWSDENIIHSKKIKESVVDINKVLISAEQDSQPLLFFNSVAFKYQQEENNPGKAAYLSHANGFIPTTSGDATGIAPTINKIKSMKEELLDYPNLAIASGVTPENIKDFKPYISHVLISTGISKDFYNFSEDKLAKLIENSRK